MNHVESMALWAQLKEAGLTRGEAPAASDVATPWYVRAMLGIAGWIGALFLLGFVAVGFKFIIQSTVVMLMVGALLCAAATAMFRIKSDNDFISQFGFAVSLTGQVLILFGLGKHFSWHMQVIAPLMAAIQVALFLLIPNFLHRVWSATMGLYAMVLAVNSLGLFAYAHALLIGVFIVIWLNEFRYPQHAAPMRALGYGIALFILFILFTPDYYWMSESWWNRHAYSPIGGRLSVWLGTGLVGLALVWTTRKLLSRVGLAAGSRPGRVALAGAVILALVSLKAPGIALATTMLIIGYAHGNRVLTGLGILGLLVYLAHLYYALQFTLLEKSVLLMCCGATLLAVRLALHRWQPAPPDKEGNRRA